MTVDTETVVEEEAYPTDPETSGPQDRVLSQRFSEGRKLEEEIEQTEAEIEDLKTQLKDKKEHFDFLVTKMRRLFEPTEQGTLFSEEESERVYPDTWLGVDTDPRAKQALMDVPQLAKILTPKLLEKLNEAGVMTFGDAVNRAQEPGAFTTIPGIGQTRSDALGDAISDYIVSISKAPEASQEGAGEANGEPKGSEEGGGLI